MTLHVGLTYSNIVQSFSLIPLPVFELHMLKPTTTTTRRRIIAKNETLNYISVVPYANITILLANMHMATWWWSKGKVLIENESENGIFQDSMAWDMRHPYTPSTTVLGDSTKVQNQPSAEFQALANCTFTYSS